MPFGGWPDLFALVLAMIGQLAFVGLVLLVIGAALGMYAISLSEAATARRKLTPGLRKANAGTPEANAGTPEANAGTPEANAGTPEANAGTPEANAGTPEANAGTPSYIIASGALVLLLFAWTVTTYANWAGIHQAEQVQSGLPAAAEVIVYSSTNLSLSGPGVTMSTVQAPDSEFRFRYDGLRFLVGSGGNDFLLPERWRPGDGSVIVLPAAGGGDPRGVHRAGPMTVSPMR